MAEYRPSFSVPAVWIAVDQADGTVAYYELDGDGCLVLTDGIPKPHHVEYASNIADNRSTKSKDSPRDI